MRDGITLAADVYLPAGTGPWPAVVVHTPYSKDFNQGITYANYLNHFAEHGYAAVIVDFRGIGASNGTKTDSMQAIESDDAYDSIEQIATTSWCNGDVGVWGVSYGGIAALRTAAAKPPHLRAVVAVEGSTDPYEHEIMRWGAPGLAEVIGAWSSMMLFLNCLPPANGGNAFRIGSAEVSAGVWAEHLHALTPWHFAWRDHPTRDGYWLGRAVDPAQIAVPTMIVTGWRDIVTVGAWQDYNRLAGPRRLVAGPWQHGLPDQDSNHPIHSIDEMIAWFDQWMPSSPNEQPTEDIRPYSTADLFVMGADIWESYDHWPVTTTPATFYLGPDGSLLGAPHVARDQVLVTFDATVGIHGGLGSKHVPADQRLDDDRSVTFTSDPLTQPLDVLGQVVVQLRLTGVSPDVDVATRIVDIAPDDSATLITKGYLKLSNLAPGYVGDHVHGSSAAVSVTCNPVRWRIAAGHRIRLAIAAADFPEIWPSSQALDWAVDVGGDIEPSRLVVPRPSEPPTRTPTFNPPDPTLVRNPPAPPRSDLIICEPDRSGLASVQHTTEMSLMSFAGDLVDFTHTYRASTVARRPERTQLTTDGKITVTQPHRIVAITGRSYSSRDVATADVEVTIDGHVVAHKQFHHQSTSP